MADSIPFTVRPLQPTLVRPFHRDGWVFEIKIDGWRIVAYKSGRHVCLVSRTGVDHTARFRNLAAAVATLGRTPRSSWMARSPSSTSASSRALTSSQNPTLECWPRRRSTSPSTCSMPGARTFGHARWRPDAKCWRRSSTMPGRSSSFRA
jgi:hypothetical protein